MPETKAPTTAASPTVKFAEWKGEPPMRPGSRERQPNPYDAIVQQSFDAGNDHNGFEAAIPDVAGHDRSEVVKAQVRLLRNAARHIAKGVDIRVTDAGLWFKVRERKAPRAKK